MPGNPRDRANLVELHSLESGPGIVPAISVVALSSEGRARRIRRDVTCLRRRQDSSILLSIGHKIVSSLQGKSGTKTKEAMNFLGSPSPPACFRHFWANQHAQMLLGVSDARPANGPLLDFRMSGLTPHNKVASCHAFPIFVCPESVQPARATDSRTSWLKID